MDIRCREALHILIYLVTQSVRISAEVVLGPHDLHRCESIQLILELFSWFVIGLLFPFNMHDSGLSWTLNASI